MNIAVLVTPEIRNIGNAFINQGAFELIAETVPFNSNIHYIETFETGNILFNYPTKCITEANKRLIESCDWLIVLGGSCLSRYMINMFNEVKELKVKKILLGAGFYEGIEKELPLYKDLPEHFDWIFTRDKETFEALKQGDKYDNIVDSIDMAFWMDVEPYKIQGVKPYSVINIDSPERGALQEKLYREHKHSVMSRNDSSRTDICNTNFGRDHKCFVAEKWYEYIKLYANAEYVATNRVHTFLACILADIPCQIFIDYTAAYERFFLFKQIGLKIETGKLYTSKDYEKYINNLLNKKIYVEEKLYSILNKY
jgi:Polysaccharide pyruvyl transferase